ncbi:MAG: fatty acid hydroxylase family protein, partial [Proteobacteria bacterium]
MTLAVIGIYVALLAWETVIPARALPPVRGWRTKGGIAFLVYVFVSTYLPLIWGEAIAPLQLFDLGAMPVVAATVVGLLTYELGVWVWHRTMHRFDVLWRSFHQMHHSAERIDVSGAFWFSPLDMIGWTALFSLCLTVVGLPVQAIIATNLIATLLTVFQHANLR